MKHNSPTNQSVAALRNEIDAGQGRRSAPDKQLGTNLEQGLSSLTGEATASTENRSRKSPSQQVAILCRHGDEIGRILTDCNRHSTVTHYQRPNMTHPQEGGTGGEVSEILFFSAKSKRRPSLIYSMQIIPVCLSIVARRKGVSATRRGGLNWTPISLLVGHPCKLFHRLIAWLRRIKLS